MIAAATSAVGEHGYIGFTVGQVIEGARVSRQTFYEHFANKEEVVLAAYDQSFARLLEGLSAACASQSEWPSQVREAIAAGLSLAASEPAAAALVTIHAATAGEEGVRRVLDSGRRLAALLAAGGPDGAGPPGLTERALVGAIWTTVANHLMAGEAERLPELGPGLAELTLLAYPARV